MEAGWSQLVPHFLSQAIKVRWSGLHCVDTVSRALLYQHIHDGTCKRHHDGELQGSETINGRIHCSLSVKLIRSIVV